MKVHFIAIGGSVMHHLAIALRNKGYEITGSDDEIFEPSYSKLQSYDLLPKEFGWFPEKIHKGLDAVIVGMHARSNNPELKAARRLGLKIYNFPEYIYEISKNKQRIVIAGSHGKTTVTSMIIHVLNYWGKHLDFLVGATSEGRNETVRLSNEASGILLEGDEYPSSPLDPRPKFLHYHHHIGVVTGIAWDHVNAYPVYEDYVKQFKLFVEASCKAGTLIYCEEDEELTQLVRSSVIPNDVHIIPYRMHNYVIKEGITYLVTDKNEQVPIHFFGEHNLLNVSAALEVALKQGIRKEEFYEAISTFKGASKRLDLVKENSITKVFRDFAHAPSKVRATTEAVKNQFPNKALVACLELHTFSSLNPNFIENYKNTLNTADLAILYINPETVARKGLSSFSEAKLRQVFNRQDLILINDEKALYQFLTKQNWLNKVLLLMSSGNFNNLDITALAEHIIL
ncbi:MAG: Mur ligase family protein [Bacteroidota bacterium]